MDNIFLKARQSAAVNNKQLGTRERASELLGFSVATLANYELGVTKTIPPDAVVMMADVYNAPELKVHYCASECPIGRGMPVPTTVRNIELLTCLVMEVLENDAISQAKRQLIEISVSEKSTKDKLPTLVSLLSYLDGLSQTIGELRLSCQKLLKSSGIDLKGV